MPWIARDKGFTTNPYRIFAKKPNKVKMVNWDGEITHDKETWTCFYEETYGPLGNGEKNDLDENDSPVILEPGDGPVEVYLSREPIMNLTQVTPITPQDLLKRPTWMDDPDYIRDINMMIKNRFSYAEKEAVLSGDDLVAIHPDLVMSHNAEHLAVLYKQHGWSCWWTGAPKVSQFTFASSFKD